MPHDAPVIDQSVGDRISGTHHRQLERSGRRTPMTLTGAVIAVQLIACTPKSDRIECPVAVEAIGPGALGETGPQISVTGEQLGNGDENAIGSAIATLRARHPGAKDDAIVNDLMTAYCPSLNRRSGMDLAARQKAMRDFSARVQKIINTLPNQLYPIDS